MSIPTRRADLSPRGRSGFTLIEILVVLAIMALSMAVIMPSLSRMLDQATAHAVFFEFQRQVSDLRREANRTGVPIRLVDPVAAAASPGVEGQRTVTLRRPWRYTVAPALDIDEGGACRPTSVNLVNGDTVVMTLRSEDASCQFIRYQTAAETPTGPSSRR